MALAHFRWGSQPAPEPSGIPPADQRLWDNPLLLFACSGIALLLAFQLAVTLLQPAWTAPVTAWLQVLLGWASLLVIVLLSHYFTHTAVPVARSWWCISAGLLANALARTMQLVEFLVSFPHPVPRPTLADLFLVLQYPWYLLALLLVPLAYPTVRRTLMIVDGSLLLGAAFALSWYFLLAPIYQSSHETLLGKLVNLSLPLGDLAFFFGLTMIWLRYRESGADRRVVVLLIAAVLCLIIADSWYALLLLHTSDYQIGSPPDLFWMAFILLVPLSALVRFRLAERALASEYVSPPGQQSANLRRQDLFAGLRVTAPVAAAMLVSAVLFIHDVMLPSGLHPIALPVIALFLLGLALVRQGLTAVENERLRREREEAFRETTTQMETFLGMAGHELKNPLASIQVALALIERRMRRLLQRGRVEMSDVAPLLEPIVEAEHQEERIDRLVSDLVDVARVRAGKLDLHLAPTDLASVVCETVEEQRQVNRDRTFVLECPEVLRAPVIADAQRLGQVVTNYLTNALKYSPAERPITVGLQVDEEQARVRVWVHDEGPGLPPEEQERIWERYHRAPGIKVQSGSGVGLGLGLHVCRTIIELHHGQVGVQSTLGQGSTFWFSLPLATAAPAREGDEAGAPED